MGTDKQKIPSYVAIASKIERNILQGKIAEGQKLGSIRRLAQQESVSINTIRAALDSLCQSGIIHSLPRIGFVVSYQSKIEDNLPFEKFTADCRLAEPSQQWLNTTVLGYRAGSPLFRMTLPTDSKMFKSFQRQYHQVIMQSIRRETDSAAGLSCLRKVISQHLAQRNYHVGASDIQITNGCQHALEHALRVLCKAGDTVAIAVPAFPGYFALLGLLGLKVLEIPMSPLGPDPDILQQVMASQSIQAVILNPNCHNPTGITITDRYKKQIADWAASYQVPIIEDDICSQLHFVGHPPNLIASYDSAGWCLVVSSISKVIGDSERIGWCCPGRFKNQYMTQFAVSQISSSYFLQQALSRYYQGSLYQSQLRSWRRDIKVATTAVALKLKEQLGKNIQITPSTGSYALWVKLPADISAQQLHASVDLDKVDFLSGELFSLEPRFKHFIRLIIMPPLTQTALSGIDHLIAAIQKLIASRTQ